MDFVTVSTGLILPYWMGLPIRYIQFENPDLDNSREDVDFGVGFYTTQNKEMAKKWASSKRKSTINT